MRPQDVIGRKAHGQMVAQGFRFGKKLDMPGMQDVVTSRANTFFIMSV